MRLRHQRYRCCARSRGSDPRRQQREAGGVGAGSPPHSTRHLLHCLRGSQPAQERRGVTRTHYECLHAHPRADAPLIGTACAEECLAVRVRRWSTWSRRTGQLTLRSCLVCLRRESWTAGQLPDSSASAERLSLLGAEKILLSRTMLGRDAVRHSSCPSARSLLAHSGNPQPAGRRWRRSTPACPAPVPRCPTAAQPGQVLHRPIRRPRLQVSRP